MKSRVVVVLLFFGSLWTLLLMRVFFLQMFPHARLQRLEQKQYETRVVVEGRRGSIYDRNGLELAVSVPAYSLYGDPSLLIKEKKGVAKKLATVLGGSVSTYLPLFKESTKRFVWIRRQLPVDTMQKIKNFAIKGLGFIEEPIRVYPDEEILKPILGVVGRSGAGLEGIEKQYDSVLRGNPKRLRVRRDARGRPLQVNGLLVSEAEDGSDIHLTLDRELQYVLHRELSRALNEHQAAGALGVILDAETSEVRALDAVGLTMAGEKVESTSWMNRPILEAFEPGSTMKTFVVAAGLKEKKWQPNTKFFCENGQFKVGAHTIGEADVHHQFGWLTISEILSYSSNIGVAKMALSLGPDVVKETLENFGFGQKTGVDLSGEAKGILQKGPWKSHLLSTVSFGHGMTATPLQIANAYAAIANGGVLREPRVTQQEAQADSLFQMSWFFSSGDSTKKQRERRVLTEAEAQTLRLLLAGVVGGKGTGMTARVEGYPVGGKTGTAQKVNPHGRGYLSGVYVSSFAGMIPANNPRFVIYVAVDSPKGSYYGSQVAAPLFSRLATFAVQHEGLAPRWLDEQKAEGLLPRLAKDTEGLEDAVKTDKEKSPALANTMPNLKTLTLREVQQRLPHQDLKVSIYGTGRVVRTEPEEGAVLSQNSRLQIWLSL